MDKTIEVIVVAMVAIATAVGLIFMVQGQSGSFLDFTQGETSSAKCSLWEQTGQCDKYNSNCEGTLPPEKCDSEDTTGSEDTTAQDDIYDDTGSRSEGCDTGNPNCDPDNFEDTTESGDTTTQDDIYDNTGSRSEGPNSDSDNFN